MTTKKLKPTAQFETITPDIANEYLKNNKSNRNLDNKRIARYAREMELGRWLINGDTIRFDTDGILLDAQHRLEAIVKSGVTVEALVVRDLPKEAFATIDVGKNRSGGDILTISGHQYVSHLASAARRVFTFDNTPEDAPKVASPQGKVVTHTDILDVLKRRPTLPDDVAAFCRGYPRIGKLLGFGSGAALQHLFHEKQAELAREYFRGLETGANLDANSVIYQVREKLIALAGSGRMRAVTTFKMAIIVKGWNLMRDGFYDTRLVVPDNLVLEVIK